MKVELLNGANLAFIGDAYYELRIRLYLVNKGITNQNELHKKCVEYVSAKAHAKIVNKMINESFLTLEEADIYKRGRNHSYNLSRKNLKYNDYICSSGLEAVVGYLYLKEEKERLDEVIRFAIKVVEEKDE